MSNIQQPVAESSGAVVESEVEAGLKRRTPRTPTGTAINPVPEPYYVQTGRAKKLWPEIVRD